MDKGMEVRMCIRKASGRRGNIIGRRSRIRDMTVPVASRHASPFPTPQTPAQIQDIFFNSMRQQPAWMDPDSYDTFRHEPSSTTTNKFLIFLRVIGSSNLSYMFPGALRYRPNSFRNLHRIFLVMLPHFIPQPVPSSLSQDHAPPVPATNIIPPTPFQTNAASLMNTIGASPSFHERFPEEREPVTRQEGHTITGRRSAELNAALDVGFAAVERGFLDLSMSTTLPISQLINLFLKSRGRTVNDWNLRALAERPQPEAARPVRPCARSVTTNSKRPIPILTKTSCSCTRRHRSLDHLLKTIAQRGQGFQKHYRRVIQILESASAKSGFEAAIVLCGKVVNEDGSLGHSYNTASKMQFWQTRCRASDDAIIGHLKAHVYNSTSLAEVDEAFHDDTCSDLLTPHSPPNNGRDQSQAPEGRDDALKWVKLELIKQVAQLGGKCAWDKNFPWKGMSSALADANLCIKGYPTERCLLPGETHNENSKNKGIGALTQKEIAVLVEALKSGTMKVVKVDKAYRASVMASERPVITGIAPPSDWPHAGARRLFVNGDTDYHGPARLKPSNATTKVKKADKVTKAPPPPNADANDDDDSDDDHPIVPTTRKFRKFATRVDVMEPPPSRPFRVVTLPPSHPLKVARKPGPTAAAQCEVIEISTSAGENVATEPESEYEEARGKKRKLKFVDTSHALKRPAPSSEKSDTSKVEKKAARPKQPKTPALPTSPIKGGPLSPLTVGSSSVAASPEPETAAFLQDGPSNVRTKVKPRPLTKESKGREAVAAVKSGVSSGLDHVPKETLQKDLPSEAMQDDGPVGDQQEPPRVTNPIKDPRTIDDSHDSRDPPANPPQAHDELSVHHDPREGIQQGSDKGDAVRLSREPQHEIVHNDPHEGEPLHDPREPRQDPRDTPHHVPRNTSRDPHQPLRNHSHTPITEHDALYPRDAFYHRDVRNHRYAGSQPPDHYGPEPRTNDEYAMRDSSPALEVYRDDHYAHSEHERSYSSRYSPVLGPNYARENGYSRRDDLDERRALGGGTYRGGYPQGRTRYHNSRWADHIRDTVPLDYVPHDNVARSFSQDPVNPPRPPSS
ncbi:hypothetical protein DFJ58DRAFT_739232 [Suillus subalutaceus]|uniref:uncharacterized protein n=1 Tax=Suillus subalutaceus TaxID=48586 RepID=UPI001B8698E2|nr:uncharacterized protein DFJ58DRAFT_739232 [Suillus subalutaceus]KAG1821274.1 hypothetical protein DFJ58DRAFT_739232 [Suillus subalutaceus]